MSIHSQRIDAMVRAVLLLFLLSFPAAAQTNVDVQQRYLDLSNDFVLMDLSAHPDDEDGATLAYYRMKEGVKTYSVLFTRGEGGQNETGPELYEELGVLRTAETKAAGKILGTEVRFLNFLDFGFSKSATEAFRMWGGQTEVLRRLVYMIRLLKPDVIFTNHNTIDGHGHHQAVAITAIAAFDAAADSTMFPEQLKESGISLWQPRKLFFRAWGRSAPTADVSNDILEVNPARGEAYLDIASRALRMHRTQGMERANLRAFTRGKSLYKLMRTNSIYEQDSTSFFSGIDLWRDPTTSRLADTRSLLDRIHPGMEFDSLLGVASTALAQCDSLDRLPDNSPLARRMLAHWRGDLQSLIGAAAGVEPTFTLKDRTVIPRQRVESVASLSCVRCGLGDVHFRFDLPRGWAVSDAPGIAPEMGTHRASRTFLLEVGDQPKFTLPRVSAQYAAIDEEQHVAATISCTLDGHPFSFTAEPAFDVAPPMVVSVSPAVTRIAPSQADKGVGLDFSVKNYMPHKIAGVVSVEAPRGWRVERAEYVIPGEDSVATGRLLAIPPHDVTPGNDTLRVKVPYWSEEAIVRVFDVALGKGIRLGIIKSYDNTLEEAAGQLGVKYSLISDDDINRGDLSSFTTIVVDIRAYLVRDALKKQNDRLLAYVRNGGNLVVMYQKDQEWRPEYAPYPFNITRARVTDETAPVHVLLPGHPLLSAPNRIGGDAWLDWKQERGVYFPGSVPGNYDRLISCSDPDEPQLTTGYLVARYGSGSYIYTSYVWYRELKEENPGAYRCFANMISYPAYRK